MAKKKEDTGVSVESVMKKLEETYGAGLISAGDAIISKPKLVFNVCPSLDFGLGGGVPEGSWVTMSGPEKSGKSLTALSLCQSVQETDPERAIFYFDVEHRLKDRDLQGIKGLKTNSERFRVIRSSQGHILNTKDYLQIAENILKNVPKAMVVFDSVSAMCNPTVMDGGIGQADYGSGNKLVSQFCDICASVVPLNQALVVGIVHFYANVTGYGQAFKEKAASRWKYQADIHLQVRTFKGWRETDNENAPQIGQITSWQVKTSAMGAPGARIDSYIRYGIGIDKIYELMEMGKTVELVTTSGAWTKFPFLSEAPELLEGTPYTGKLVQAQGGAKAYELLSEHPEWAKLLKRRIQEVLL